MITRLRLWIRREIWKMNRPIPFCLPGGFQAPMDDEQRGRLAIAYYRWKRSEPK